MSRPQALSARATLTALVAIAFLAAGGVFVKLSEVGPITTGLYRVLLALPLAYAWMRWERTRSRSAGDRPRVATSRRMKAVLFLGGIALGADLVSWNLAFGYTTLANANLLANMVPFVIVPLSFVLNGIRPGRSFLGGLAVTVVGLVVLVLGRGGENSGALTGDLLATLTAVFYGTYLFIVAGARERLDTGAIMYYTSFGAIGLLAICAAGFERDAFPETAAGLLVLVACAVLSQVAGQGLMAVALREVPVNLASILVLSQPVIAAIYGVVIFSEGLTALECLGILIVLVGIYAAKRSTPAPREAAVPAAATA